MSLDCDLRELWERYLRAEDDRIRSLTIPALNLFIDRLLDQPSEIWQPWAKDLAAAVSDRDSATPVRFPLFRRVLLPALAEGVSKGEPGCARWLAAFEPLLAQCQPTELTLRLGGAEGLLREALRIDPGDHLARRRLIDQLESFLDYTLHEVPTGVLYDSIAASLEQCEELLRVLTDFRMHIAITGQERRFEDLISRCEFHYRNYQNYLRVTAQYDSYERYLIQLS